MRISTVAGIGSAASLLASIAVPIAFQQVEPWVGQYLLVAAGLLFALALGLWWPRRSGGEGSGTTITTGGPNSPGFGTVHGNVTIQHGVQDATQWPKSPYGSGSPPRDRYTLDNLAGLSRVMHGGPYGADADAGDLSHLLRRPRLADVILRRMSEQRKRCPEMPIWEALGIISARIGDSAEGFPQARGQFRQAALEGRVDVWGQLDIPSAHMKDNRRKQVWTKIDPEYWHDYELNILSTSEKNDDKWHTEEEELPGRRGNRYWSLRAYPEDIDRRWPEPIRTTNDRKR